MAHLTLQQRYQIEALRELGSLSQIAQSIGNDKSVISRELRRNADQRNGAYRADLAHRKAQDHHKPKPKPKNIKQR